MKKKLTLGICLVLVLGLAVGGTLALFNTQTDVVENTFTVGSGVDIDIKEPAWDGSDFDGTYIPPTGEELGKDTATNFGPTDVINKNPQVKNNSDDISIFAAMEIVYSDGITSYDDLANFATIDFNTNDWEFNATHTVAYYKHALAKGEKTKPVFNTVTIAESADASTLKGFKISVKGYAVQKSGEATIANIKAMLQSEFSNLK